MVAPRSGRLLQAVDAVVQPYHQTRFFSPTLRYPRKDVSFQARLDERLLPIEVKQIQAQLSSNGTQQSETRRRGRRSKSLNEINTLTLFETPCHQPRLRPHQFAMIVRLLRVHPLRRNDVQPAWLFYRPKRPRVRCCVEFLLHCLAPNLCEYSSAHYTSSASTARSPGAWEDGSFFPVDLGGRAYDHYLLAPPSKTAAHAQIACHSGALSHPSSVPEVDPHPPVPCCE